MTYYDEDQVIAEAAERLGREIYRRPVVDVDEQSLPPAYWRQTPDYGKIRRALDLGIDVPGASLTTDVEYVIRRREDKES